MKREETEALAKEIGAFLIYLDKGKVEAQNMDLIAFANVIEGYVRAKITRDVRELFDEDDSKVNEENIISVIKFGGIA